jgi:hypothetical protein
MKKLFRWCLNFMAGGALDEVDRLNKQLYICRADDEQAIHERNKAFTERVEVFRRCIQLEQRNEDLTNKLRHLERIENLERRRRNVPPVSPSSLGLIDDSKK